MNKEDHCCVCEAKDHEIDRLKLLVEEIKNIVCPVIGNAELLCLAKDKRLDSPELWAQFRKNMEASQRRITRL